MSFVDLSVEVLSLFISSDEISRGQLRALVEKSYSTFRHPDITPLKKLSEKTYILELFHGPTFAFKDVALQLLGNLFEFFLARRNEIKDAGEKQEPLTVEGATSGDTGRFVSNDSRSVVSSLRSAQCCYLRSSEQVKYLDLHPASKRPCFSHSRGPNDYGH